MRRLFLSFTMLSMFAALSIGFTGCTEDDGNPITPVDEVVSPTNLQAYSDDGAVGLYWSPSESETQSNFGQYVIKVYDIVAQDTLDDYTIGAGPGAIIGDLTNGVRYKFHVYAADKDGNLSAPPAIITWAPAVRLYSDSQSQQIEVYATTSSTEPSGIDIYNANGKAEIISQAGSEFATRGDLYVYAASNTSSLEIRPAQNATNNPGLPGYFNSSIGLIQADNLNAGELTSPPNDTDYDAQSVTIADGPASNGQMYFGKLVRGTQDYYFRMLVRSVNGKLVQGSGAERYVVLEFSYQTTPNVQYAKKSN